MPRADRSCSAGHRSARCSPRPTTSAVSTRSSAHSARRRCPCPMHSGCCDDPDVNGSPFYVMSFVDGIIVRDATCWSGAHVAGDPRRHGRVARRRARRAAPHRSRRRRPRRPRTKGGLHRTAAQTVVDAVRELDHAGPSRREGSAPSFGRGGARARAGGDRAWRLPARQLHLCARGSPRGGARLGALHARRRPRRSRDARDHVGARRRHSHRSARRRDPASRVPEPRRGRRPLRRTHGPRRERPSLLLRVPVLAARVHLRRRLRAATPPARWAISATSTSRRSRKARRGSRPSLPKSSTSR